MINNTRRRLLEALLRGHYFAFNTDMDESTRSWLESLSTKRRVSVHTSPTSGSSTLGLKLAFAEDMVTENSAVAIGVAVARVMEAPRH